MAIQPGSILSGHFRIDALVGGGGMALVYRAFDLNLQRVCAIKQNLDNSPEAQRQFHVEAIVLANLSHPHLARVTDHFVDTTGQQYLVMDFVEGEDLDAYVRRTGPLAERQALAWMSGVFDALAYCHGQGVIHRDIKPANLVKRRGEDTVVLVDFGIAKQQAGGMTLAGARAASPAFAPPEQYSGHTDPRSDIYALGATLYYLLTGREPPDARLVAAGVERITPPRTLNPAISPQTERATLQAMALRVADRPQTVAELRAALAGVQPPPPSALPRPTCITALIMVALAMLAVLALLLFALVRQDRNGRVAETTATAEVTAALTSTDTSTPSPEAAPETPTPGAGSATAPATSAVGTGTSPAMASTTPARRPTSTPAAADTPTTRSTGTRPPDTGSAPRLVRPADGSEQRGTVILGWSYERALQTGQRFRVTLRTEQNQSRKELQLQTAPAQSFLLRFEQYPDYFTIDNTEYFWSVVVINQSGTLASGPSEERRFVFRSAAPPPTDQPPTSTPTRPPPTSTPTTAPTRPPPTPTPTKPPPTSTPTPEPTTEPTTEPPTSTPTTEPPTSTPTTEPPTSTPTTEPPTSTPTPEPRRRDATAGGAAVVNGYSAEFPQRRSIRKLPAYSSMRNMETSL